MQSSTVMTDEGILRTPYSVDKANLVVSATKAAFPDWATQTHPPTHAVEKRKRRFQHVRTVGRGNDVVLLKPQPFYMHTYILYVSFQDEPPSRLAGRNQGKLGIAMKTGFAVNARCLATAHTALLISTVTNARLMRCFENQPDNFPSACSATLLRSALVQCLDITAVALGRQPTGKATRSQALAVTRQLVFRALLFAGLRQAGHLAKMARWPLPNLCPSVCCNGYCLQVLWGGWLDEKTLDEFPSDQRPDGLYLAPSSSSAATTTTTPQQCGEILCAPPSPFVSPPLAPLWPADLCPRKALGEPGQPAVPESPAGGDPTRMHRGQLSSYCTRQAQLEAATPRQITASFLKARIGFGSSNLDKTLGCAARGSGLSKGCRLITVGPAVPLDLDNGRIQRLAC
ncbi:hypothetical protein HRG_014495 [Hirsutella rhossiliensis]